MSTKCGLKIDWNYVSMLASTFRQALRCLKDSILIQRRLFVFYQRNASTSKLHKPVFNKTDTCIQLKHLKTSWKRKHLGVLISTVQIKQGFLWEEETLNITLTARQPGSTTRCSLIKTFLLPLKRHYFLNNLHMYTARVKL